MNPDALQPGRTAPRALTPTQVVTRLSQLNGWTLAGDGDEVGIEKTYAFPDFHHTMAFANAVAYIAQVRNHHPELRIAFGTCTVFYRTHDAGGLTALDFESAEQVDQLTASVSP